jgi:hypothetical protein
MRHRGKEALLNLSYRTRRNLRRIGKILLICAIVAAVAWACWMLWVARFIIYDRDLGAKLDFSLGAFPEGVEAIQPTLDDSLDLTIHYKDPVADLIPEEVVKTSIQGYYLNSADLKSANLPALMEQLGAMEPGTAIMLDMKAPKGWFYYTTDIDDHYQNQAPNYALTAQEMDELIRFMESKQLHLIARIPALRDYWFGRYNVPCGLPEKGKAGALWMDNGCYWLDPTSDGTLNYLVRISKELQSLGFDEVVFYDFRIPETDKIIFTGDKAQAIANAAVTLATACATDQLCVSFEASDPTFPLPEGNCRIYLRDVAAADVDAIAQQVTTPDASLHVLFITTASDASDTRFEKYCVLRPLESAR